MIEVDTVFFSEKVKITHLKTDLIYEDQSFKMPCLEEHGLKDLLGRPAKIQGPTALEERHVVPTAAFAVLLSQPNGHRL